MQKKEIKNQAEMKAIQASLINDVLSLEHDPLAFCRYVFP